MRVNTILLFILDTLYLILSEGILHPLRGDALPSPQNPS
jgi:hypothetical protein